jgi:hypothetical protein
MALNGFGQHITDLSDQEVVNIYKVWAQTKTPQCANKFSTCSQTAYY